MLDPALQGLIGAAVPLVAAGAAYLRDQRKHTKVRDSERTQMIGMLMGLAQSRIVEQGMTYIERGWVTADEFEDLHRYLYDPYHNLGGNGTAERIMHAVERLPIRAVTPVVERAFAIPIRENDPTGLPHHRDIHEGEDRRDRDAAGS